MYISFISVLVSVNLAHGISFYSILFHYFVQFFKFYRLLEGDMSEMYVSQWYRKKLLLGGYRTRAVSFCGV